MVLIILKAMVVRMDQMRIDSINDGDIADPQIVKGYGLELLCSNGRYNFVGYINKNRRMLLSCPKRYK